jgi:outer membrane protein, adhesin transport system
MKCKLLSVSSVRRALASFYAASCFLSMATIAALPVSAQVTDVGGEVDSLQAAINKAISEAPEVKAAWYEFRAVKEDQRIAKGGYLPRVDLESQIGHEISETPVRPEDSYVPDSTRLTMTQMLFDGFATRNEVARQGYLKLASYYDFVDVSEKVTADVIVAYLDVLRYRELVELAKENYIQHTLIFDDIEERVTSGLGRRVDLEQATGRLALSESNLLTEATNLHDVTVRFHRLVGAVPAEQLQIPELNLDAIPLDRSAAIERAYDSSPEINAAIERVRAAKAEVRARRAPMMPRFDLRFRQQFDHDTDGLLGRYDEQAIELVMNYNLYRGGSDSASKRRAYDVFNQVIELREQACRNVRQQVVIAHNNISAQTEQVGYLDRNQRSIGKAREAYRKQFDIGQRTLLDLLDTESEYFDVRRALVNAKAGLQTAQVETLQAMGILLDVLTIEKYGKASWEDLDRQRDKDMEWLSRCPAEAPQLQAVNKQQLLESLYQDPRFRLAEGGKVAFRMDAKFEFQSSEISDEYQKDLKDAAEFLRKYPAVEAVIEGHTDYIGTREYNLDLSQRRAEAVRRYLIDVYDVSPSRLKAKGWGEEKPIADNETDEGRSLNRRVELVMESIIPKRKPRLSDFNDLKSVGQPESDQSDTVHPGWSY